MRVVFVHGACVRDGAWWWHRTATVLAESGVGSTAAVLPSCGETGLTPGQGGPSLQDDVAAVRDQLRASDEPAVVVAHSYGGVVVAEAAAGLPHVRHLVAVASFLPEVGESLSSFGDGSPAPFLEFSDDGTFGLRPQFLADTFLHDCPPSDQAPATARLVRQTAAAVAEPVRAAAWRDVPTTYVVCAGDRGTSPATQRQQAQRALHTVDVDTGHHPFLAQPRVVAQLVLQAGQA